MKRRCFSLFLVLTVFLSFLFSCVVVHADDDNNTPDGYLEDLFALARLDCPSNQYTEFDYRANIIRNNFSSDLIIIFHNTVNNSWYFVDYKPLSNRTLKFWYTFDTDSRLKLIPRYSEDYYDYNFTCPTGFKIINDGQYNLLVGGSSSGLGNTYFDNATNFDYNRGWTWNYPIRSDFSNPDLEIYINGSIRRNNGGAWNSDSSYDVYIEPNLISGFAPPVYEEYELKVFYLGERRYLTITNQEYIRWISPDYLNLEFVNVFYDDTMDDGLSYRTYTYDDVVLIEGGTAFVSGLTNVSPLGVYAIDITDFYFYGVQSSYLWSVDDDDLYGVCTNTPYNFNQEEPQPGTNGTPDSYTESWTLINEYIENYPQVTIAPDYLANQLLGNRAVTACLGYVKMPTSIYDWCIQYRSEDIVHGDFSTDGYWHYKLDRSGIDSSYASMINWSLCNACIIPVPDSNYILEYLNIDVYQLPVYANTGSDVFEYIGDYYINDLYTLFDVLILAPSNAFYLSSIYGNVYINGSYCYSNIVYESPNSSISWSNVGASVQPVFIIGTDSCIQKSQLFVFCDGISKVYDVLSQYMLKRDLMDNSFMSWSMSMFYQLNSVNGKLGSIYTLLNGWNLNSYIQNVLDKLDTLVNNTNEQTHDFWILPIYEYVSQFVPSMEGFGNWIDAIEDVQTNVPSLPQITVPPISVITPTPIPIGG